MFIYEPGSGFNGDCHMLKPGDELLFEKSLVSPCTTHDMNGTSSIQSELPGPTMCDGVSVHDCDDKSQIVSR